MSGSLCYLALMFSSITHQLMKLELLNILKLISWGLKQFDETFEGIYNDSKQVKYSLEIHV